jgi:hypothetical protein
MYTSVTASASTIVIATKLALQKKQQKPTAKLTRPDTRLFIYINLFYLARIAGFFAILTSLKKALETDTSLLKAILAILSSYALYTSSSKDLATLTQHSELIANTFSDYYVEPSQL